MSHNNNSPNLTPAFPGKFFKYFFDGGGGSGGGGGGGWGGYTEFVSILGKQKRAK